LNNRSATENNKRSLVLFPDDKNTGLVRPFRAVSLQPSASNQARPVTPKQEAVPNYRTVIGASYDDLPSSKTVDDDFEDIVTEQKATDKKTNYTKQELYDLCVKEVPDYLRNDLCGSLVESKQTKKVEDVPAKNSQLIQTRIPPKPVLEAETIQLEVVTEKTSSQESFLLPAGSNVNFLGIPLELPVEVKRKGQHEEVNNNHSTFKVYRTSAEEIGEEQPNKKTDQHLQEEETTVHVPFPGFEEPPEINNIPSIIPQPINDYVSTQRSVPLQLPPSNQRPEARQPPGYFSRLIQLFGGSKPAQSLPPQPQRVLRKRINA
jgi:hypothetical protein